MCTFDDVNYSPSIIISETIRNCEVNTAWVKKDSWVPGLKRTLGSWVQKDSELLVSKLADITAKVIQALSSITISPHNFMQNHLRPRTRVSISCAPVARYFAI